MPALAVAAAGTALTAYSQKRARQQAANAQNAANEANQAAHTMTPQEKAQYFSSGVGKVNDAFASSQGLLDDTLAARGLGGNALVAPHANLGRSRARAIGDVWNQLVQTAMNMRTGTPTVQPVTPAPSGGQAAMQVIGDLFTSAAAKPAGNQIAKMFA